MVQALLAYSPHKHNTDQVMTMWDHTVRLWMENMMATAYGVAPALSFNFSDVPTLHEYIMIWNAKHELVPKLDNNDLLIVNPNYEQELFEFGKALPPPFQ